MKKITLLAVLATLFGCGESKTIEEFYKHWLDENSASLNEIERLTLADSRYEKIWTVGDSVGFSILKDGDSQSIDLPKSHAIYSILPKHNNMLYFINNTGMYVGVGITSDCNGYACIIGMARYKGAIDPFCRDVQQPIDGLVCAKPLKENWYLRYQYLYKNEENT